MLSVKSGKMTVDNLGPTASGMNFGKYSAQNDVCSFDYSTSVRLIKTETDKAFQFLYCLPYLLVSKATQPLLLCIKTRDLRVRVKELMAGMSEHDAQV